MAKTVCKAKQIGKVKRRGKASIEWKDEDGTPHYYYMGYTDARTEELIHTCKECSDNMIFAQKDLEQSLV
jgi:hypothetical protein